MLLLRCAAKSMGHKNRVESVQQQSESCQGSRGRGVILTRRSSSGLASTRPGLCIASIRLLSMGGRGLLLDARWTTDLGSPSERVLGSREHMNLSAFMAFLAFMARLSHHHHQRCAVGALQHSWQHASSRSGRQTASTDAQLVAHGLLPVQSARLLEAIWSWSKAVQRMPRCSLSSRALLTGERAAHPGPPG